MGPRYAGAGPAPYLRGKGGPTGDDAPCVGHRTAEIECTSRPRADRFGPVGAGCAGAVLAFRVARRTALLLPVQRLQLAGGAGERRVVTRIIVCTVYDGILPRIPLTRTNR
jgi:hypothetical protein